VTYVLKTETKWVTQIAFFIFNTLGYVGEFENSVFTSTLCRPEENWKRNNHRSFWISVRGKPGRGICMIDFCKAQCPSKYFPSTLKRKADEFYRFQERFWKYRISRQISVDGELNRGNTLAFSNFSRIVWSGPDTALNHVDQNVLTCVWVFRWIPNFSKLVAKCRFSFHHIHLITDGLIK